MAACSAQRGHGRNQVFEIGEGCAPSAFSFSTQLLNKNREYAFDFGGRLGQAPQDLALSNAMNDASIQ